MPLSIKFHCMGYCFEWSIWQSKSKSTKYLIFKGNILSEIIICKPNNWHAYFCPAEVLDYIDTQPGSKRQAQSLEFE